MNKQNILLSVVLSFRNESDVLPEFVRRIRSVLSTLKKEAKIGDHELIFVNDASTDDSQALLLSLDKGHGDIKILTMSRNFGVFPCVMAGLAYSRGNAVVYMDCDLQDPPEIIPQLIEIWQISDQEIDVVHTVRRTRKGESRFKLWLTSIGYRVINRYSSVPIPKDVGDFKLLSRRMVNHLIQMKESRPYLRGLIAYLGFNQTFFPYDRHARFAGKSKFFILGKKAFSNFLRSGLINFSSVPLQIASYCGLCAIFIDFLLVIYILVQKITGRAIPGWSAIMITIVFIGGVQLFCMGMIGLYIDSIHEATKNRPNYIIAFSHGFEE